MSAYYIIQTNNNETKYRYIGPFSSKTEVSAFSLAMVDKDNTTHRERVARGLIGDSYTEEEIQDRIRYPEAYFSGPRGERGNRLLVSVKVVSPSRVPLHPSWNDLAERRHGKATRRNVLHVTEWYFKTMHGTWE